MSYGILYLGILIFAAYFFVILFQKTKIPDVLLLTLMGFLLGPKALNILSTRDFGNMGEILTTIALIVILFEGGVHLKIKPLKKAWDETLLLTLPTFLLSMLLFTLFFHFFFHIELFRSLIIASILCGITSAVVLPIIENIKISSLSYNSLFMEAALTDVLCIILTFSLIQGFESGHFSTGLVLGKIIATLLVGCIMGAGGAYLWLLLLKKVREFPTNLFSTIAFIFIIYGLIELMGFNGIIGALAFGITLANLPQASKDDENGLVKINTREKIFFKEMVFLLKIFFFIYLGISLNLGNLRMLKWGLILTKGLLLLRMIAIKIFLPRKFNQRDATNMAILIPKGLSAAVLATILVKQNLIRADAVQDLIYTIILFSIALSALMIALVNNVSQVRNFYYWFFGNFQCNPPDSS